MPLIKKVVYKKLGRRKAFGLVEDEYDTIYIDPRLKGRKQLEILIHEAMHILYNKIEKVNEENEVILVSVEITKMLWAEGYRKADHDESVDYQE